MSKEWTSEEIKKLIGLKTEGKTYTQIGKILNRSRNSIRGKFRTHNSITDSPPRPEKKNKLTYTRTDLMEAIAEGTNVSRPYTEEEMFDLFKIDPTIWTVTKKVINTWANFFQTKLWLARNKGVFEFKTIQEEFNTWAKNNAPLLSSVDYNISEDAKDRILEINMADPHFDKLAWGKESGDNYDIKIAKIVFIDAVQEIIYKARKIGFSKILLILGNDLFNSEGKRGTTTEGTPQDTDVRWKRSFSFVVATLKEVIDICQQHTPVSVVFVLGNHDEERTYYAGEAVKALFLNCADVFVDNTPKSRKYYQWGKNMLQFLHGYTNKGKIKWDKLPQLMAQEEKQMWAETEFRYSHIGHEHHNEATIFNTLKDEIGITVQIMPSIAGTDGWHYDKGYIGHNHQAKGFIYDKEKGLEYEINYYAPRYFYLD